MATVEVFSLSKYFDGQEVVKDISLNLSPGEILGLIGPDGAGKSTLIRMIAGLIEPSTGNIVVNGIDVAKNFEKTKHTIGYMPQVFGLYGLLSVEENLRYMADVFGIIGDTYRQRSEELYRFSGLGPFKKRRAAQLSGGMKQKLGLSCVLVHRPDVLLLDEPTNGVDPVSRREFWEMLHTIASEGKTILVSTPYMDEAERCHRVAFMEEGRFIALIDPKEALDRFFLSIFDVLTENPRICFRVFAEHKAFASVTLKGQNIHLVVQKNLSYEEAEKIIKKIAGEAANITKVSPTMQDVYFRIRKEQ